MPRISVIIPVFNGRSRFLTDAIQSVLTQTFDDFELILVDDASTDHTHEVVPKHSKITYYRRDTNGGQAAARNTGAHMASGECLAFLDQDDLWEPAFLEDTVPMMQSMADVAVVHTDGYTVNAGNEILNYERAIERTDGIGYLLRGGHLLDTSGSLFRTTHFDGVNGYDENLTIWEDTDLGIRLYQTHRLQHIPKPLYRHRIYTHNVSRDISSERALAARKYFLEKHAPSCRLDPHLQQALRLEWARFHSAVGKHHLSHNQSKKARESFLQSLRHDPFSRKTILRYLRSWVPFWTESQYARHVRRAGQKSRPR